MQKLSYGNEFDLQENEPVGGTVILSLRCWQDFARECFCFGGISHACFCFGGISCVSVFVLVAKP